MWSGFSARVGGGGGADLCTEKCHHPVAKAVRYLWVRPLGGQGRRLAREGPLPVLPVHCREQVAQVAG